jgi:hypothetical protein
MISTARARFYASQRVPFAIAPWRFGARYRPEVSVGSPITALSAALADWIAPPVTVPLFPRLLVLAASVLH